MCIRDSAEFGYGVYTAVLAIPAQSAIQLHLELAGTMDLDGGYLATLGAQPLVHADDVTWDIRRTDGDSVQGPSSWSEQHDAIGWAGALQHDMTISVDLSS